MLLNWKKLLAFGAILAGAPQWAMGFSLLGPGGAQGIAAKEWQLPANQSNWQIGYNRGGLDIGAPVAPDEAYRLNIPVITYGYDERFLAFFGTNGVKAIDSAIRILNDLPATTAMSADLSEFPLNASHLNYEAAQLGLIDLKSAALGLLVEHMGLADSVRWVYAIRNRINVLPPEYGIYTIIRYNYDPVTLAASSYVNGTLWTYEITEIPRFSDATEIIPPGVVEPINIPISSLSSFQIVSGYFFTGLTRDDVGGLRYLYSPRNIVAETLLPGISPGGGGAWSPYVGTNFLAGNTNNVGTNALTTAGKRGGVNKIHFEKVRYDTQFFVPFNQTYRDRVVIQGGQVVEQTVLRTVASPDILFTATDLLGAIAIRTSTANWINNEAINGASLNGGPGVILPPVLISFNKQLPQVRNEETPFFYTEPFITDTNARAAGLLSPTWASFDGSTNPPIIYPQYLNFTIDTIRNAARGNGL